jgi:NitT/TauT family transport system substrate-binding protein
MAVRIAALFGLLIGAALAGLPVPAQTLATVKVASAGIASDIGFFLAHKKGYFRAEGLNVELTQLANSPQMIGPLGRGQLDVGAGTVAVGLYNAVERDIALRAVADKGSMRPGYGFSGLLVRKDLVESGRYRSLKDLKGMKIAVGTFGSANASAVNEALKRGGLTWTDATMVELSFPQHLPAHAYKAIDASMTNEPTATEAVKQGFAVRVAGNDEIYPNQQTAVVLYSELFMRRRPSEALGFMRGYIKRPWPISAPTGRAGGSLFGSSQRGGHRRRRGSGRSSSPRLCDARSSSYTGRGSSLLGTQGAAPLPPDILHCHSVW